MEIKARAFPHPVLAPNGDDYANGVVAILDAEAEVAPERYSLQFRFEVTHEDFRAWIAGGSAAPAVVVECRETLYRVRHQVGLGLNRIEIPADELRGEVQVTPVVSARRDFPDFRPRYLNQDYHEVGIAIPAHALLAYGPNLVFEASPQADRLRNVSSIMRVRPGEVPDQVMTINYEGPRILVDVPEDTYKRYRYIALSRRGVAVLASMLVLPVLIEVFNRIKQIPPEGREDLRARSWFRVVSQRLREIKEPIEAAEFEPLRAAQRLLDSPFVRGTTELFKEFKLETGM